MATPSGVLNPPGPVPDVPHSAIRAPDGSSLSTRLAAVSVTYRFPWESAALHWAVLNSDPPIHCFVKLTLADADADANAVTARAIARTSVATFPLRAARRRSVLASMLISAPWVDPTSQARPARSGSRYSAFKQSSARG